MSEMEAGGDKRAMTSRTEAINNSKAERTDDRRHNETFCSHGAGLWLGSGVAAAPGTLPTSEFANPPCAKEAFLRVCIKPIACRET